MLGPVLIFNTYINDIGNITRNSDIAIMLFADDINVFLRGENVIDLKKKAEDVMQKLSDWLKDNRLSLKTDKTEYGIFHQNMTLIPDNCNQLSYGNYTINRVRESKYLGMITDDIHWYF